MPEPDFFAIDQNSLDREWTNQPALCEKYGRRLADAQRDLEQAETRLEIVVAELDVQIRARAERKKEKLTEAAVKSKILQDPERLRAVEKCTELRHKVGILKVAVKTIDHRKTALENLVDLRLADYFSEPRARGAARADLDERQKRRARAATAGDDDD